MHLSTVAYGNVMYFNSMYMNDYNILESLAHILFVYKTRDNLLVEKSYRLL